MKLTLIQKEALEMSKKDCIENYTIEHIEAWKELEADGLVDNIKTNSGAFYRITSKGLQALKDGDKGNQ